MKRYLRAIKRRILRAMGRKQPAARRFKVVSPKIETWSRMVNDGNVPKAEKILRDYLLNEPLDAQATALLGTCRMRANDPDEAITHFKQANAIAGYVSNTRSQWAEALYTSGQDDAARSLVLETIDYTPRSWQHYWDYAAMVEAPEHHAELLKRWQKLLVKPSRFSDAIDRAVAKSATLVNDFDLAYDIYRRLIATELHKIYPKWEAAPDTVIPKVAKKKKNELSGGKGETCLIDFKAALDAEKVPFFLMAGTVLGYVRDGALLPGDKDVDIGVFEKDYDRPRIEEILKHSGKFQVQRVDNHADRIRAVHLNGVWLDVFPYFQDGNRTWHAGTVARWWHEHFDLKEFEVNGVPFMIPANTDDYLEWNYGEDWRIPNGLFDVYDDAPNAEIMRQDFLNYGRLRKIHEALKLHDWPKVLKYVSKDADFNAANPWMQNLEKMAAKQVALKQKTTR